MDSHAYNSEEAAQQGIDQMLTRRALSSGGR